MVVCWFYMGITQIPLDHPHSVKQANVKKVLKTILKNLYSPPFRAMPMETIYFKKGLPSATNLPIGAS